MESSKALYKALKFLCVYIYIYIYIVLEDVFIIDEAKYWPLRSSLLTQFPLFR